MVRQRAREWGEHVTRGGLATVAWLEANDLSVEGFIRDFAADSDVLNRLRVQRAINGHTHDIKLSFAQEMHRATGGAVEIAWWSEPASPPRAAKRAVAGAR